MLPPSRLVSRVPRPSRCDAGFHHGLLGVPGFLLLPEPVATEEAKRSLRGDGTAPRNRPRPPRRPARRRVWMDKWARVHAAGFGSGPLALAPLAVGALPLAPAGEVFRQRRARPRRRRQPRPVAAPESATEAAGRRRFGPMPRARGWRGLAGGSRFGRGRWQTRRAQDRLRATNGQDVPNASVNGSPQAMRRTFSLPSAKLHHRLSQVNLLPASQALGHQHGPADDLAITGEQAVRRVGAGLEFALAARTTFGSLFL